MNNIRTVQSNPRSTTVQVYNAQVLVREVGERHYKVECNLLTAIGMVPCEYNADGLCWHSKLAIAHLLHTKLRDTVWFEHKRDAYWMWAGNSTPMSLVHVESKGVCGTVERWAVVQGMWSGIEQVAHDMQSKGA